MGFGAAIATKNALRTARSARGTNQDTVLIAWMVSMEPVATRVPSTVQTVSAISTDPATGARMATLETVVIKNVR